MGLEGLRIAVRIARVRGEAASSQVLKQVLQRHGSESSTSSSGREASDGVLFS